MPIQTSSSFAVPRQTPAVAALAALPEGVLVLAPARADDGRLADLVCEYANPAAERLLGHVSAEIVGRSVGATDLPVPEGDLLAAAAASLEGDTTWERRITASAGPLTAAFRVRLVPAGGRLLATLSDESAAFRATRALERRHDWVTRLGDLAHGALAVMAPDGALVEADERLASMCGCPADDLAGASPRRLPWAAADAARVTTALARMAARGEAGEISAAIARDVEGDLPVRIVATPLDAPGEPGGLVLRISPAGARDESRAAAGALAAALAAAGDALLVVAAEGGAPVVSAANEPARAFLAGAGGDPAGIVGMPVTQAVPLPGVAERCRAVLAGFASVSEVRLVEQQGALVPVALRIARGDDGAAVVGLRRLDDRGAAARADAMVVTTPDGVVCDASPAIEAAARSAARGALAGSRMPLAVFGEAAGAHADAVLGALRDGEEGEVDVIVPGGTCARAVVVPLRDAGGGIAGTLTALHGCHGAARPADEEPDLEARAAATSALHEVAVAVASSAELYDCFDLVAEAVARLLGAGAAGVVRFEPDDEGALVASWTAPAGAAQARGATVSLRGESAIAQVARTGEAARVDNLAGTNGSAEGVTTLLGLRSSVATPVRVDDRLWGAVAAVNVGSEPLPPGAEELLQGFTDLVALAVTNAEHRAMLEEQARTDQLTSLPNRRAFEEQLAMEVERAVRHGYPLALALLDVDHFKQVNDTYGHAVGDRALTEIARRLVSMSRGGEMVARVGGEEFAWILPGATVQAAVVAVERASRAVAGSPVDGVGTLTVSAGVSDLAVTGDATRLLETADRALYMAKSRGRNLTVPLSGSPPR